MKSDRNRPLLALALTLALLLTQSAPAYAAESTTQADAVGSIAADYDADEGEVHNTINADSLLPEADPADGVATFASYSYETELAKFPKSYQVLLAKLHKKHPNWVFIADQTNLDFATAVDKESNNALSYLSPSACSFLMSSAVKNTYANSNTIAYYMDPRNYFNEKGIFLFVDINHHSSYTQAGVKSVLSGTDLAKGDSYAKTILNAGSKNNMNPYFLAGKIITETGGLLSQTSICGTNKKYPGIYNFYNIGAYTGAEDGLKWASQKGSYQRPWNTQAKSISGGASMIYSNFYKQGQETIYYTRFNVGPRAAYAKYYHQYMSSLYGGVNEAERMYKGYQTSGMNGNCVFHIPVFKRMPSTCSLLNLSDARDAVHFTKVTEKAKAKAEVRLRSGPANTYDTLKTIPTGATFHIHGGVATDNSNKAYQIANPYWFYVTYAGTKGYVSAEMIQVSTSYNLKKGSTHTLPYTLADSADPVYFLSSNTAVAKVNAKGKVTGVKNGSCTIYTFCGGGFDAVGLTVSGTATNIPDSGKKPATTTTKLTDRNTTLTLAYTKKTYSGGTLKPAVTVKHGSKTLTHGEDYTVSYHHNSEPGPPTAKITGTGKYTRSLSKTFQITGLTATYRTTSKVNYRSGVGTSATKKGSLAGDKPVQVYYGWHKTVDGCKWYKVRIGGSDYYMSGNYLKPEVLVTYQVKSNVNYRTGAGTSHTKKGQFKKGTSIAIVQGWSKKVSGKSWYRVKVGSKYYYVMASYLTKKETILAYTNHGKVNVRTGAGTDKTRKTKLLSGTPVHVVKGGAKTVSGDAWERVKVESKYYYIMASYLTRS